MNSVKNACSWLFYQVAEFLVAVYRDILAIYLVVKVETKISRYIKNEQTLSDLFRNLVKKNPNKPCIIYNNKTWTFKDVLILKLFS